MEVAFSTWKVDGLIRQALSGQRNDKPAKDVLCQAAKAKEGPNNGTAHMLAAAQFALPGPRTRLPF